MDLSEGEESSTFTSTVMWMTVLAAVIFWARRFFKGAQFTERVSAKEKVAVVTGANTGIGLETVRELNLRKAKVYMLCRDENRCIDAKAKLVKVGCDPTRLIYIHCDLANFESIRKCAKELEKAESHIDILINNAGIMWYPKFETTVDGHELHWQSNYLGPFLLTELLLPLLKKSVSGRIVNLSSKLHKQSDRINTGTIDDKKQFGWMKPYNRSKLANVLYTRELARRLRKEGTLNVTVNCCHPGVVETELLRYTFLMTSPIKQIISPITWFFLKTARDGAQTSLFLALSKKVDGISGKYFADCAIASENPLALDDNACEDLYNYSIEVTNGK